MPGYNNFKITLDPRNASGLTTDITENLPPPSDDFKKEVGANTTTETINLIRQAEILTNYSITEEVIEQGRKLDPDREYPVSSIYGKANKINSSDQDDRDEVSEAYKDQSCNDANRFRKLTLEIDDQTQTIENLAQSALDQYNNTYPANPKDETTMDMIVDYLQETHRVIISKEQRDFLCSQGSQDGARGSTTLVARGLSEEAQSSKTEQTFVFKDSKLHSLESSDLYETTGDTKPKKFGKAKVVIDISNLASDQESESVEERAAEDYLPKHSPKSVEISYESKDGLSCTFDSTVEKALKKHNALEGITSEKSYIDRFVKAVKTFATMVKSALNKISPRSNYTKSESPVMTTTDNARTHSTAAQSNNAIAVEPPTPTPTINNQNTKVHKR